MKDNYPEGVYDMYNCIKGMYNMPLKDLKEVFGVTVVPWILQENLPFDIMTRYNDYKGQQIRVGNEISFNHGAMLAWVIGVNDETLDCVTSEGSIRCFIKKECEKTGRHSETLAKLFDELRSMKN